MPKIKFFHRFFILLIILYSQMSIADVVKPALIEISVNTKGFYNIVVRTSIEALLAEINSDFKNTNDSPNAEQYDYLRKQEPAQLKLAFEAFHSVFTQNIHFKVDGVNQVLSVKSVEIPLPGYVKVPRTSIITLTGKIERNAKNVIWLYPKRFGDNAVRVKQIDPQNNKWHWSSWQWLRNGEMSKAFSLEALFTITPLWETVQTYVVAGFEHILPKGLDHILFILGIFLLSTRLKPLLWQVTMFTVAHSITLGLSMANYISLPANIVEPLIALSIAYIGIENIIHKQLHKSRLVIVFIFGLLHGLGFASVLSDFGMPKEDFLSALISFNVGVELGQLAIILLAYVLVTHWFKHKDWYRNAVIIPASVLISMIGLYWTYDRVIF